MSDERPDIYDQAAARPEGPAQPAGTSEPDAGVFADGAPPDSEGSEAGAGAESGDAIAAERDEYLEALRRTKAEFDNYRKRAERDRQSAAAAAAREVVRGLLPVMDNLERAVEALGDQGEAIVAGVEMVRGQLAGVLSAQGVAEIPAGEQAGFDPNVHEAIAQIPAPGRPAGTIIEVVEKGYTHAELVLRPSKVVVAAEGGE